MKKFFSCICYVVTVFLCLESSIVIAKPPPWAPAHGYRDKPNKQHSNKYQDDRFGIGEGLCSRQSAGQYLGQALANSASTQINNDSGRLLATVTGILLGEALDRQLDNVDYFCTGQALEFGRDNQLIRWTGSDEFNRYGIRLLKPVPT